MHLELILGALKNIKGARGDKLLDPDYKESGGIFNKGGLIMKAVLQKLHKSMKLIIAKFNEEKGGKNGGR